MRSVDGHQTGPLQVKKARRNGFPSHAGHSHKLIKGRVALASLLVVAFGQRQQHDAPSCGQVLVIRKCAPCPSCCFMAHVLLCHALLHQKPMQARGGAFYDLGKLCGAERKVLADAYPASDLIQCEDITARYGLGAE